MPGMRRREFVSLFGGAAVAWPLTAHSQQPDSMRRIGVLTGSPRRDDPDAQANIMAFLQVLQQLGWTDGRNVRIEYRWGMGDTGNIRKNARAGFRSTRARVARARLESREMVDSDAAGVAGAQLAQSASRKPPP